MLVVPAAAAAIWDVSYIYCSCHKPSPWVNHTLHSWLQAVSSKAAQLGSPVLPVPQPAVVPAAPARLSAVQRAAAALL